MYRNGEGQKAGVGGGMAMQTLGCGVGFFDTPAGAQLTTRHGNWHGLGPTRSGPRVRTLIQY